MSNKPLCLYEVSDHVATITLNRPHRLNAFNTQSYQQTTEAFYQADADPRVRCIILTGAGRGFCSGDDVEELMGGDGLESLSSKDAPRFEIPGVIMARTDRPIIAAVNGAAVGYGFEIALLADIRIAADTAKFSQMFIKRGLVAGASSFTTLNQLLGPAGAAELLLTGDLINAQRALELGVVSAVFPSESLLEEAHTLAARIACNPPLAVRRAKQALQLARRSSKELETHARDALAELMRTADHKESVAAYLEKREPQYRGT